MYAFQKNCIDEIDGGAKMPFIQMDQNKREHYTNFYWQDGYGAFSVKPSEINNVINYIAN